MKKILLALLLLVILLVGYILFKTATFTSNQLQVDALPEMPKIEGAVDRFVEALAIRTVSFEDPEDFDSTQFELMNSFLEKRYPLVHEQMEHRIFNSYSHLYKWQGSDPSLQPIILMGHLDVVPIASPFKWTVHPFTEGVKNDTIYGRGTMDDKINCISLMETAEQLLRENFSPKRTIYLSFGHDEEVSGHLGAETIVKYLKAQNVKAEFVLDEGGLITNGIFPGLSDDLAVIGIAEKGYLSLELEVNLAGGHSSSPAAESSIDVLSSAITRLKATPFEAKITPALEALMNKIGPEMDFSAKMAFANSGLLKPLILDTYQKSASGNAMVRTTIAPTIFKSGIKENVIPTSARAVINFRILPGETLQSTVDHVTHAINDARVIIRRLGTGSEPSPVSPTDNAPYTTIETSLKQVYPGLMTSPYLVLGATDARYYTPISDNIYRFTPYMVNATNMACFHGIDERVAVSEYQKALHFYRRVMINAQSM